MVQLIIRFSLKLGVDWSEDENIVLYTRCAAATYIKQWNSADVLNGTTRYLASLINRLCTIVCIAGFRYLELMSAYIYNRLDSVCMLR